MNTSCFLAMRSPRGKPLERRSRARSHWLLCTESDLSVYEDDRSTAAKVRSTLDAGTKRGSLAYEGVVCAMTEYRQGQLWHRTDDSMPQIRPDPWAIGSSRWRTWWLYPTSP